MSAPGKWGKEPLDFVHDLEGENVLVKMTDGKSFKGKLVGADPYNLVIEQESSSLQLMINKGQMIYLHASNKAE